MTPREVNNLLLKLANEGMEYGPIAKELAKAGAVGRKGPYTEGGVSYKLRSLGYKRRGTPTKKVKASALVAAAHVRLPKLNASDHSKLAAVKTILALKMSAQDVVSLAQMVLGI